MGSQPKNHHYVANFHLAQFTSAGTEDGELFVLDKRQRRKWRSTPKSTARQNNFYKVDLENVDPMGIEKAFAEVEGKCAAVVREVIATKGIATGDAFEILLNFVALSCQGARSSCSNLALY